MTMTLHRVQNSLMAAAELPGPVRITLSALTCGMMRWKMLPSYVSFFPILPMPFSPVHSARKFSTVFGTVLPNRPMTILPAQQRLDGIGSGPPALGS